MSVTTKKDAETVSDTMCPLRIKTESELLKVKDGQREKLVVVYMMAEWCLPCQRIGPEVDSIKKMDLVFVEIDVDHYDQIIPVALLPCFVLFKSGEKVETVIGTKTDRIFGKINKYL